MLTLLLTVAVAERVSMAEISGLSPISELGEGRPSTFSLDAKTSAVTEVTRLEIEGVKPSEPLSQAENVHEDNSTPKRQALTTNKL